MSIMMTIPPALEVQTASYVQENGTSLEAMFLEYLRDRLQKNQRSKGSELIRKLRAIREEQPKLEGEPYRFRRQDAYDEVLG